MYRLLTTEEFLEEIPSMRHQGYFRVHLSVQLDACKVRRMNVRTCPELQCITLAKRHPRAVAVIGLVVRNQDLDKKYSLKQVISNDV